MSVVFEYFIVFSCSKCLSTSIVLSIGQIFVFFLCLSVAMGVHWLINELGVGANQSSHQLLVSVCRFFTDLPLFCSLFFELAAGTRGGPLREPPMSGTVIGFVHTFGVSFRGNCQGLTIRIHQSDTHHWSYLYPSAIVVFHLSDLLRGWFSFCCSLDN